MDVRVNAALRVTYAALSGAPTITAPDPEHDRLIAAGFTVDAGRLYLAGYSNRFATANTMDTFEGEWWVNDVHLESSLQAADQDWRLDALQQGVRLIEAMLPGARRLVDVPVQAFLNLQSSVEEVDYEFDFPVGAVHFHRIRQPEDDYRQRADEPGGQPLMIVTDSPAVESHFHRTCLEHVRNAL